MSCRTFRRHVDPFVDGELDPTSQLDLERHLAVCSGCQERVAFQRALKAEVKRRVSDVKAPSALRERVLASLAAAPPPTSATPPSDRGAAIRWVPFRPGFGVSLAAAAVMLLAFGNFFGAGGDGTTTQEAGALPIFEDVVRRHTAGHPSEVAAASPDQVSSWFRGKVEFPVRPVTFPRRDAHLVGWRLSWVHGREAATLYYDVHGRRVTVVAMGPERVQVVGVPVKQVAGRAIWYRSVRGYPVAMLQQDGVSYVATGDLDPQSLLRLAASAQVR